MMRVCCSLRGVGLCSKNLCFFGVNGIELCFVNVFVTYRITLVLLSIWNDFKYIMNKVMY
jgi:hypothetical protein